MTLQEHFLHNVGLQKQWHTARNGMTPEGLTAHSREKVWWKCEKGHEWRAAVDSRVYAKHGCPYCAKQIVIPGETDIPSADPQMEKLWHPMLNGDLKPSDISPGSRKKVWWQCEKGHSWKTSAYSIKAGTACPYCSGRNVIPGETDLATTHPHLTKIWGEQNRLLPYEVTAGSSKKVWWKCEKGHQWEAVISSVAVDGCRCPYCAGKRAIPGETDLATLRPGILEQWDFEKNTLSPRKITEASHDKVWWKCDLGHSYEAVVFSRTREKPTGCPYCAGRKVLAGFNDLATLKPKIAAEWCQKLNGTLTAEMVTLGSNRLVWWQCNEGHVWRAAVYSRTRKRGSGCPVCAGVVKQKERVG